MNYKYFLIGLMALIVLFVIHLLIVESSLASYKTPSGLYSATDKVSLLTVHNFNENVYNSTSAWLVQFYNSWCGHCIKFSPIWKQLAASVYNWRNVVIIGAIDCADDQNTQLCRDYEIMGYPTIRYFPPLSENFTIGRELSKVMADVPFLRKEIINLLQNTETKVSKWPDFSSVNSDTLPSLWEKKQDQMLILVVEKDDSYVGRELIMDLNDVKNLMVRYTFNSDFARAGAPLPQILAIQRNLSRRQLTLQNDTRESVFLSAQSFLVDQGYDVTKTIETETNDAQPVKVRQSAKQLLLVNKVFMEDLESSFSYSLFHEVTLKPRIFDDSLQALKSYLRVMSKYFPFNSLVHAYVNEVIEHLRDKSSITGGELRTFLKTVTKNNHDSLKSNIFVGCRGSTSKYRGYPCSVWMTFHTLSVQAYLESLHSSIDNQEVVNAMIGYIGNFFGCQDCAEHFLEMSRTMAGNVSAARDSVLWLWRAHNTVNQRLAADFSEDPSFPKIQFPAKNMCPDCRHANDSWREDRVLTYLVQMYSDVYQVVKNPSGETSAELLKYNTEKLVQKIDQEENWNFSLSDVKTCIALYVLSACLLTVYTVRFFLKRNRRSRNHKYDFYNKA